MKMKGDVTLEPKTDQLNKSTNNASDHIITALRNLNSSCLLVMVQKHATKLCMIGTNK